MPKINLRLTDEEHDALKEWAQSSQRSIQREAVYRLFAERTEERPTSEGRATGAESSQADGDPHRSESGQNRAPSPATDLDRALSERERKSGSTKGAVEKPPAPHDSRSESDYKGSDFKKPKKGKA